MSPNWTQIFEKKVPKSFGNSKKSCTFASQLVNNIINPLNFTDMKEMLLKELVNRDFTALYNKVANIKFETAFKVLDGKDLDVDVLTMDGKVFTTLMFEFEFGCLCGTMFSTPKGGCELYDMFDVWVGGQPIALVSVTDGTDAEVEEWY